MRERTYEKCPIAIVGMSCRLPGANDPDELWSMLVEGRDAFRPLDERWRKTLIHPSVQELKPAVPRAALLDHIDGFDAGFFGISPREAARMDPQQRLLLELAWEAFEAAGIDSKKFAGERVGVFIGFSTLDYWSLTTDSANRRGLDAWTALGGYASILANRISYAFDFRGPSLALDSACSASLYATHAAKESLRRGECRLALAGGVNLIIRPEVTASYARAGMLSPTGESHPFGENANGFVRGEGAALVLMRRLEDALACGDTVRAVVRGSAVSQDGRSNGITVPTVHGQVQLLELAYSDAGIDPARVRYVEAHGTGTPVGDPIELEALGTVFGRDRSAEQPCLVGSIKSNIGHLEAGAGAAGMVKAVLMLDHDQIPRTLACTPLNPEIPFEKLRLKPVQEPERLRNSEESPVVGVNSFGFGGTNVHVVLEGPPPQHASSPSVAVADQRPVLVALSARGEEPLRQFAARLADRLRREQPPAIADVAHTLGLRRSILTQRAAVVSATPQGLAHELDLLAKGVARTSRSSEEPRPPVFVLSGMGPQWWGMGRRLMSAEPIFRATIEEIDALFQKLSGWSILARVFLAPEDQIPSLVERADVGHPAHFALQVGLAELLESWGVRPCAVVGHSAGEVAAACVSGRLSREDAVRVLYHRSRLVQRFEYTGNMVAVQASLRDCELLCERHPALSIAAVNGPSSIALSGPASVVERVAAEMTAENRFARIIPGCFPYHSPVFEPIREELVTSLGGLRPLGAHIPLVSSVSGTWAAGRDFDASYWWHNVRDRVSFEQAVQTLWQSGQTTFVELGAHPALLRAIRDIAQDAGGSAHGLPTLKREEDDLSSLLTTVGELWAAGHPVRLDALVPTGRLVSLPGYAWHRQSYWIDEPPSRRHGASAHPVLGERTAADAPTWQSWVSESTPTWAPDHRVDGQTLLPATSWVESWFSAALEQGARLPLTFKDVQFSEMLPLGSDPTWVRVRRILNQWTLESASAADPIRWTVHGTALQGSAPAAPAALDRIAASASLQPTPMHYADYDDLGYAYGEAFRLLSNLWPSESGALARIAPVPDPARDAAYVIHPATLDAALQAILPCMKKRDGLYLPVAMDRVTLYRRAEVTEELWTRVDLRDESDGQVLADVRVADEHGAIVAAVDGMKIVRVGPRTLLRKRVLYREAWKSIEGSRAEVAHTILKRSAHPCEVIRTADAQEASQEPLHAALDDLARAYAAEALKELGSVPADVTAANRMLVQRLAKSTDAVLPADESLRELCKRYPGAYLEGRIIETFGGALSRIVMREVDPHELFFSATGLASAFHSDSETVRAANCGLRDAICREIAMRFPCAPVRILEIGAGTGGTTAWVLPHLDPDRTEYVATDLSSGFTRRLEQRFRRYPFLSTRVLDIEQDPEAQGFAPQSFDIVLAASALHATADLGAALEWCRRLLRPHGLLLLSEPVQPRYWLDLVFGTLEGWWRFKDRDVRADHPLISSSRWESLLTSAGFLQATSRAAGSGSVFSLLAARVGGQEAGSSTHVDTAESWLIVTDGGPQFPTLIEDLAACGGSVCLADRSKGSLPGDLGRFDHVLYLSSPRAEEPARDACGLLELVHALRGASPQLTIVTHGAHQVRRGDAAPRPAESATWGFGRVLAAEHPELRVRLRDLSCKVDHDEVSALVCELQEIAREDKANVELETEVALRGMLRFVPRVVRTTLDELETLGFDSPQDRWTLASDGPGPERSLSLRAMDARELAPGEIEVRIEAQTLLSHDLEGEPAGTFPCIGEVRRVGAAVAVPALGDRVVGYGPGGFASHAIAPAHLFVSAPPHLTNGECISIAHAGAIARHALRGVARLAAAESILVHHADQWAGPALIRLARQLGSRVLATAAAIERSSWLLAHGADEVLDAAADDFQERLLARTIGRGVDVVVNCACEEPPGGPSLLAVGGRWIELRQNRSPSAIRLVGTPVNASFHAVDLARLVDADPTAAGDLLRATFEDAAHGMLGATPYVQFPLGRLAEAVTLHEAAPTASIVVDCTRPDLQQRRPKLPLKIRPDATYLITGGCGGFGLATARWLVETGARHLVLFSRTGDQSEAARRAIGALCEAGARVSVVRGDVSSRADVESMLRTLRESLPPLRGVFHAAMVLEDHSIGSLTEPMLREVFTPKAMGAWQLHLATRDMPLDYFVMFSSLSRTLATPGQAAYVAANYFLQALVFQRRSMSLPATCIDWGIIEDVGYVFRNPKLMDRLTADGFGGVRAADALDVMGDLMSVEGAAASVFRFDWTRIAGLYPNGRPPERYDTICSAEASETPGSDGQLPPGVETIRDAGSDDQREAAAVTFVRARAAAILRVGIETLDPETPLVRMGFDSLMEVELRAKIQRDAGIDNRGLLAARRGSVRALAHRVLDRLGYAPAKELTAPEASPEFVRWLEERRHTLRTAFDRADLARIPRLLAETLEGLTARVDRLDEAAHRAHRTAFRASVSEFFLASSMLRRAHDKPLGYPGDFELMKEIYLNRAAGEGVEASVDAFALALPGPQAVRNRVPYLRRVLERALQRHRRIRVASIGCGPAWEVRDLWRDAAQTASRVDFLLVDQDQRALDDCRAALQSPDRGIEYACADLEALLRKDAPVQSLLRGRELIYSTGLFDYFLDENFTRYLEALYACVAPGGELVIGNLSVDHPNRWLIEYVSDWFVHHRSRADLERFASALDPAPASMWIEAEPLGINLFLVIRRPE